MNITPYCIIITCRCLGRGVPCCLETLLRSYRIYRTFSWCFYIHVICSCSPSKKAKISTYMYTVHMSRSPLSSMLSWKIKHHEDLLWHNFTKISTCGDFRMHDNCRCALPLAGIAWLSRDVSGLLLQTCQHTLYSHAAWVGHAPAAGRVASTCTVATLPR